MITVFNRVRLFADSSPEAMANVKDTLRRNGIPCDVRTLQNHTALGKGIHASIGVHTAGGGMRASAFSDSISYTYIIYIRRKDEARARALCSLPEKT